MSTILHIILAGGKGTRFGELSKSFPKALLPLANTTLLERQIRQSVSSGISQILIVTARSYSPSFRSLRRYPQVKIVYRGSDEKSPLHSLYNVLRRYAGKQNILLSLGDIYFRSNPFGIIHQYPKKKEILLAAAGARPIRDLSPGGIVFTKNRKIISIIKRPNKDNRKGYRWSGTAIFRNELVTELETYLGSGKQELEEFFEYCRQTNYELTMVRIPDFINVNAMKDFQISYLYNLAELYKGPMAKHLIYLADIIRSQ
jgi:NDP-sugar pyrophosphorylase family protein